MDTLASKLHRARANTYFVEECVRLKLQPSFTFIPKRVLNYVHWGKERLRRERDKILMRGLKDNQDKMELCRIKFNENLKLYFEVNNITSEKNKSLIVIKMEENARKREEQRDSIRNRKLENLKKQSHSRKPLKYQIKNLSGIEIDNKILKILERGWKAPIGGRPNLIFVLKEFDSLIAHIKKYKAFKALSPMTQMHFRGKLIGVHEKLSNCFGQDHSNKLIKNFLNTNKELAIVLGDKNYTLVILKRNDYNKSLLAEFGDLTKFQEITEDPAESDAAELRAHLRTLENFTDKQFYDRNKPVAKIKFAYGLAKTHKDNFDSELQMRPIVSAQNSITQNIHTNFFKKILNNINCTFTIKGSDDFSSWFRKHKFDTQEVEYASFDIVKLYPSVDTELLLEFLIQTIYSDNRPNQMLPRYRDDSNNLIRPIPKTILKPVLAAVLTKLTAFRCIDKYYRQIKGLAMGDSSSPKLANFYLHMLEKDKIRKLMDDGIIVGYKRFQDDTIVIFKKGFSEIVKSTFESLHESLEITMEKPGENGLSFLDFVIYEKDGQLEIKNNFKHSVPMNFCVDTAPISMKKGLLISELKRGVQKHSIDETLKNHISEIKEKYLDQQYPPEVIEDSIKIVQEGKKKDSINWEEEKAEFPERNFILSIPFTSKRVSNVTKELRKLIKSFLPEFNLHVAHRTLSVRNSIISNLLPKYEEKNVTNTVYVFSCKCQSEYIGESENLNKRIQEHQQPKRNTAVFKHIKQCDQFLNEFNSFYNNDFLDGSRFQDRFNYLKSMFKVLHQNLAYKSRKQVEALEIVLKDPILNKQVDHLAVHII